MTGRQDLEPELAYFYDQFTMSNGDHESMLGYLNYVGLFFRQFINFNDYFRFLPLFYRGG